MDSQINCGIKEILDDSSCVREYVYAVERLFTQDFDAEADIQPVYHFANTDRSAHTPILVTSPDRGVVLFTRRTPSGTIEQEYSSIGFVRDAHMTPLQDRQYASPGKLYSSLSIVSPPDREHGIQSKQGMVNLYRRMSTQSSRRTFAPLSDRHWTTDARFANAEELYLTNCIFTRKDGLQMQTALGQIIPEGPSRIADPNGGVRRVLAHCDHLCYTTDNQIQVSEHSLTAHTDVAGDEGAPKELGGDAIVPGQLVYVTFNLRGVPRAQDAPRSGKIKKSKEAGNSVNSRGGQGYQFRPILRSVTILSRRGPFLLSSQSAPSRLAQSLSVTASASSVVLGPRPSSSKRSIEAELKRLKIDPKISEGDIEDMATGG